MGPLATDGRRCNIGLGDSLLRSNSGFACPTQQADVLRRWAQQHRPRRRHSHGAGPWCSARDGSNAAVLERPKTAEAPARFTQTPREGPAERQAGDAATRTHAPQQLLVLAPKPRARPHAPRALKRSLALEGSAALTSLMLARALGTTVEQVRATRRCCAELSYTAAPSKAQQARQAVCRVTNLVRCRDKHARCTWCHASWQRSGEPWGSTAVGSSLSATGRQHVYKAETTS